MKAFFRMQGWLLAPALVAALSGAALAGPPFFTDDPEPVERGHWEFYLASQYLSAGAGSSGTAPHVELNYGAAPELQLHLITPLSFSRPGSGALYYGYGDTELGAKYRFMRETAGRDLSGPDKFTAYLAFQLTR